MLVVALVLAVIGLAALVTAVVASNELVAWVCIGASALGVILLIIDSIRERKKRRMEALALAEMGATAVLAHTAASVDEPTEVIVGAEAPTEVVESLAEVGSEGPELGHVELEDVQDYLPEEDGPEEDGPEDAVVEHEVIEEDHPEEVVHDEPEYDTYSDDEPDFPEPAEEAAIHTETADVPADTVESDTVDSGSDDAAAEEEADSESGPRVVATDEES